MNETVYVGLTTQGIRQRWREHVCRFNLGERDHKLYQAMRKYGIANFSIEPICHVDDKKDLPDLEIFHIKKFNSFNHGYNMTCGGDIVSDKTKKKIRAKLKGRKNTWSDVFCSQPSKGHNITTRDLYYWKGSTTRGKPRTPEAGWKRRIPCSSYRVKIWSSLCGNTQQFFGTGQSVA